jgi:hypothetical protein
MQVRKARLPLCVLFYGSVMSTAIIQMFILSIISTAIITIIVHPAFWSRNAVLPIVGLLIAYLVGEVIRVRRLAAVQGTSGLLLKANTIQGNQYFRAVLAHRILGWRSHQDEATESFCMCHVAMASRYIRLSISGSTLYGKCAVLVKYPDLQSESDQGTSGSVLRNSTLQGKAVLGTVLVKHPDVDHHVKCGP